MPVINPTPSVAEMLVARPDSSDAQSGESPLFASLFQQVRQLSGKGVLPAADPLSPASSPKSRKAQTPGLTEAEVSPQILLITPDSAPVPSRLNMAGLRALTAPSAGSPLSGRAANAVAGTGKTAGGTGPGGKLPLSAPLPSRATPADGALPPAASPPPAVSPSLHLSPSASRRDWRDDNSAASTSGQKMTTETARSTPFSLTQDMIAPSASVLRQGRHETSGTASLLPFSLSPLAERLPENTTAAGSAVSLSAPVTSQQYWQTPLDQQILFMRHNGVHSAELRLHPRELGSLKISLVMNNDRTDLAFMSEHSQVRSALEAALPHLRHALAESGISLGQSHIGREPPSPSSGFTQSEHSPEQSQSKAAHRPEPLDTAGQSLVPEPSLPGHRPQKSGVDFFA